jgi:hypothetical protein
MQETSVKQVANRGVQTERLLAMGQSLHSKVLPKVYKKAKVIPVRSRADP